ncbi:MAG: dienelactone hydrolase family protein [Rhodospirillales bacterium]|jgi:carboxymethylenebutenolidase|nr:dienelactone hydrolase family protein [Rhodospirillales bacterium]MBT4041362.1 dienelactone hydrolase family protein [Rhodospirillales bacterium]MBT4626286.1 dienelactone hydrolase family protein [Rhodospirillales bacterium]MBT5353047.1 dienelactone hydrolase family protein [Rhodospirillales bacterium]MBT5520524.1 dienelactone hydrolase family protein [Rhodospirillales bacterium]
MGNMISFSRPGGGSSTGYLATAENPKGSMVVLQEWWGLNDQIKGVADRVAAAGYTALSPDLYAGRVTQDPDEANHMMTGLDWAGAANEDVRGALQFLKQDGGKAGVMGYCMGGALTVIAGVHVPECDVAVCYYGIPPLEVADPSAMKVPFQGHFATQDDWCTPEAVAALEVALKPSGVVQEVYSYEGEHAFFNEVSPAYNADAAALSWDRTLAFLAEHL